MDKSTIPPYVTKTSGSTRIKPQHINIDGSDDPYYRYKMRQLYVQVVGKGKMIKTVLLNIDDVSRDLKIAPSYMTSYIGYEIGASSKYEPKKPDREKASISGDLDAKDLSAIVKKFIREMILCSNCNLPEITLNVEKKSIIASCRSCGSKTALNLKPKLHQFIVNHPVELISKEERVVNRRQEQVMKESAASASTSSSLENGEAPLDIPKPEKSKSRRIPRKEGDEDHVEWSISTSPQAVKNRRREMQPESAQALLGTEGKLESAKSDPLSELRTFIEKNPEGNVPEEVKRIQAEYGFPNSRRAHLLFDVLFPPDTFPDVTTHKQTFLELVTDQPTQIGVLQCMEKFCNGPLLKKAPLILKAFYDNDILEEDVILEWNDSGIKSQEIKNEIAVFVNWLRDAEEESEEE